jgi:hypothetical protein
MHNVQKATEASSYHTRPDPKQKAALLRATLTGRQPAVNTSHIASLLEASHTLLLT